MGASRAGAISSVAQCGLGWTGSKKRMGIDTIAAALSEPRDAIEDIADQTGAALLQQVGADFVKIGFSLCG